MSAWAVTSDNGETSRRNVLLADGWEPFSVVVQPETSQWGAWTEIWFRMPPAGSNHCEECDDTGCLCWRTRDWPSIDNGCHDGCHYCGRNGCQPPAKGDDDRG